MAIDIGRLTTEETKDLLKKILVVLPEEELHAVLTSELNRIEKDDLIEALEQE